MKKNLTSWLDDSESKGSYLLFQKDNHSESINSYKIGTSVTKVTEGQTWGDPGTQSYGSRCIASDVLKNAKLPKTRIPQAKRQPSHRNSIETGNSASFFIWII